MSPFTKGQKAWNKGLTGIYSSEAREKMRLAALGRPSWNKGLTAKTDMRVAAYGRKIFGEKNPLWNGGCRRTMQNYAFAAWEKARGPFPEGMILHHKDDNPRNNRIGNLACITWSEHERIHGRNPNRDPRTKRFLAKEKA